MKTPFTLSAAVAIALAGCAAQDTQVAKADCKVTLATTRSVTGNTGAVSDLDRRYAEMKLASSDYRHRQMERNPVNNSIEDALRDCP